MYAFLRNSFLTRRKPAPSKTAPRRRAALCLESLEHRLVPATLMPTQAPAPDQPAIALIETPSDAATAGTPLLQSSVATSKYGSPGRVLRRAAPILTASGTETINLDDSSSVTDASIELSGTVTPGSEVWFSTPELEGGYVQATVDDSGTWHFGTDGALGNPLQNGGQYEIQVVATRNGQAIGKKIDFNWDGKKPDGDQMSVSVIGTVTDLDMNSLDAFKAAYSNSRWHTRSHSHSNSRSDPRSDGGSNASNSDLLPVLFLGGSGTLPTDYSTTPPIPYSVAD